MQLLAFCYYYLFHQVFWNIAKENKSIILFEAEEKSELNLFCLSEKSKKDMTTDFSITTILGFFSTFLSKKTFCFHYWFNNQNQIMFGFLETNLFQIAEKNREIPSETSETNFHLDQTF